jgi:hypothetical protein
MRRKDKEREKKGRRDDATHLPPHYIHVLTPPHTSVHTFSLLLIINIDIFKSMTYNEIEKREKTTNPFRQDQLHR